MPEPEEKHQGSDDRIPREHLGTVDDFSLRGNDEHRRSVDLPINFRKPEYVGHAFPLMSDNMLYSVDAVGKNGEFLPDGIVVAKDGAIERFGADEATHEDNQNVGRNGKG